MDFQQAQEQLEQYLPLIGETILDTIVKDGVDTGQSISFKVEDVIIAPYENNLTPSDFWRRYNETGNAAMALDPYRNGNKLEVILLVKYPGIEKADYQLARPKYLEQL